MLERRIHELGMNPEQTTSTTLTCAATAPASTPATAWASSVMVMYLTGVGNIRDVLPHPRTVGNADF